MINRLEKVTKQATGGPIYNMKILLGNLTPSGIVPEVNKYYVFVYKAKTPNITYDRHPFVVVSSIHKWGFAGYNMHWEQWRKYSWNEVVSNLYEIRDEELNTVQSLDIAKYIRN